MKRILTESSSTGLWLDLVKDAEQRAAAPLDEELESYLVFTLMRHLKDGGIAERVVAIDLLQSLSAGGSIREQGLRDVGDRCLLIAGLYPDLAERRLVTLDYFLSVGRSAYGELAEAVRAALADLYRHLAAAFSHLVRVLIEVRRLSGEWQGPKALARYSLCLERGLPDPRSAAREFPDAVLLAEPGRSQ